MEKSFTNFNNVLFIQQPSWILPKAPYVIYNTGDRSATAYNIHKSF